MLLGLLCLLSWGVQCSCVKLQNPTGRPKPKTFRTINSLNRSNHQKRTSTCILSFGFVALGEHRLFEVFYAGLGVAL